MAADFPFFIKIKGVDEISGMLGSVQSKVQSLGKSMTRLGQNMTLKVSAPIAAFGGLAVTQAGRIQQLQISLQSMLGSADKAQVLVKDLLSFTAKTPFELLGVGDAAKKLLSAGVSTDELLGRLNELSDVASGMGARIEEVAKPYSKALQKGKASLEELYPIAERGAPILQILADKFGTTKDVILKAASAGEITAEIFTEAFKDMTTEGNVFFEASRLQSESIFGLFSTLKDETSQALAEFGFEITKSLNVTKLIEDLTGAVRGLANWFVALPPPVKDLAIKLGLVTALIGPAITSVGFFALGINGLIGLTTTLSSAIAGFSLAGFVGGMTAALPWILGIAAGALLIKAAWEPLMAFFSGFGEGFKEAFADVGIEFGDLAKLIDGFGKMFNWVFKGLGLDISSVNDFMKLLGSAVGFVLGNLVKLVGMLGILGKKELRGVTTSANGVSSTSPQNYSLDRDKIDFSNFASKSVPGQVEVSFNNVPEGVDVKYKQGSVLKGVDIGKAMPGV